MTYTPPSRITIHASPYLNLRKQPLIRPDNIVGRLADGSTWTVLGVARDGFNAQSDLLWALIQFEKTADGKQFYGFCRSDFFTPDLPALPATQVVLPSDGLNLRSSPEFKPNVNNKLLTMPVGSTVRVLGGTWENSDPSNGKWWFYVDFNGTRGYSYSRYLGDADARPTTKPTTTTTTTTTTPTTTTTTPTTTTTIPTTGVVIGPASVVRASPVWKFGKCLAGVGNADQNVWHEPTFPDAIKAARLESIKLVPLNDGNQMNKVYNWLRSQGIAFVMVRLTWKPDPAWANLPDAQRVSTAVRSFLDGTRGQFDFAYANGVRYFEVHNEPNITPNPTDPVGDGLGSAWLGPEEFAEWFKRVTDELRKIHNDVFLGFPGLAPRGSDFADFGSGFIMVNGKRLLWNTDKWLSVCKPAIDEKADWIGVHCYWQFDGGGQFGIENADSGGMYWRRYKTRFPNKLLFITEFSNNSGRASHQDKGRQYGNYVAMLRNEKSIGAAFAYALYWATDPNQEGWVFVGEKNKFRVGEIPGAMGAALAADPRTAQQVVVNSPSVWT